MSRTKRRIGIAYPRWIHCNLQQIAGYSYWEYIPHDVDSKEFKKSIARFHSDAFDKFSEPGPSWFRNMFTERPQRQNARRQIQKYMQNPEFEIQLLPKEPLEYWT